MPEHSRWHQSNNRAALDDAERAQELAPHYALPKAIAAWCWGQRAAHGFSATPLEDSTLGAARGRIGAGFILGRASPGRRYGTDGRAEARELLRKDRNLTVAGAHGAWPFPPVFMERLAKGLELAEVPRA